MFRINSNYWDIVAWTKIVDPNLTFLAGLNKCTGRDSAPFLVLAVGSALAKC